MKKLMKKMLFLSSLILLFAIHPALAGKNPTRPFLLKDVVSLNGAQVPAGIYDLSWEVHGTAATVTLSKNGHLVATAKGAWVKNGAKFTEDQALLRVNTDGSFSLIEIRISGGDRSIAFSSNSAPVHYSAKN